MRYQLAALSLLPFAALALACSNGGSPATDPSRPDRIEHAGQAAQAAQLGEPFQLGFGRSADVAGAGLRVTFVRIDGDSRCAVDVVCVWAGDATVSLRLERGGRAAVADLHLNPPANAVRELEYDGYVVRLEGLAPEMRSNVRLAPESYVATVLVRAR